MMWLRAGTRGQLVEQQRLGLQPEIVMATPQPLAAT